MDINIFEEIENKIKGGPLNFHVTNSRCMGSIKEEWKPNR